MSGAAAPEERTQHGPGGEGAARPRGKGGETRPGPSRDHPVSPRRCASPPRAFIPPHPTRGDLLSALPFSPCRVLPCFFFFFSLFPSPPPPGKTRQLPPAPSSVAAGARRRRVPGPGSAGQDRAGQDRTGQGVSHSLEVAASPPLGSIGARYSPGGGCPHLAGAAAAGERGRRRAGGGRGLATGQNLGELRGVGAWGLCRIWCKAPAALA